MTPSLGGPGTAVRVAASRDRADEWAVVLAAADIPHWLRRRPDGWALVVPAPDAAAALESLDAYDRENAGEGADRDDAVAPSPPVTLAGVHVALLLIGFFAITGSREGHSEWFPRGSADAARMIAGEWWRAVTALTLHADAPHLLGNALAGALLVTAVCQQLGTGVGLSLLLLAGAGGNVLTAAVHRGGHVSVGASTVVFAAIGILAVLRIVTPGRVGARPRKWWVAVAAALVLLALLGTGPNADLLAHVFGLLAGGAVGLLGALTLRWMPPAPVQWLLVAAAGAAVCAAWRLAF
ncbi:MAG: rhomboid family intramembrane serine protease [Candidatus Rokuibacteriota bacterium]